MHLIYIQHGATHVLLLFIFFTELLLRYYAINTRALHNTLIY